MLYLTLLSKCILPEIISLDENYIDRDFSLAKNYIDGYISLAKNLVDKEGQMQHKMKLPIFFDSQNHSLVLYGYPLFGIKKNNHKKVTGDPCC